jgi:TrmH family RNA methyltransferase
MNNIYIILVEPIYKGNVGSVARIMHNFEFTNLRIVGTIPQKEDYVIGVHSEEVLDIATTFPTLAEAISDLDRVIAFSRRVGAKKPVDLHPHKMSEYVHTSQNLKIGLIFGRETFGLTDEEADTCNLRCHIPANPAFPSINLAQAVGLMCYELYSTKTVYLKDQISENIPTDKPTMISTVDYSIEVLESLNLFKDSVDKNDIKNILHTLLSRANITRQMSFDIKKIFNRIHLTFHGKGKGYKM